VVLPAAAWSVEAARVSTLLKKNECIPYSANLNQYVKIFGRLVALSFRPRHMGHPNMDDSNWETITRLFSKNN
jgi:hypothetical protein